MEVTLSCAFGLLSEKEEIKAFHQPNVYESKLGKSAPKYSHGYIPIF